VKLDICAKTFASHVICDSQNTRVLRWIKGENQAQTIIANILCWGLTMGNDGSLYVNNAHEHAVKKWPIDQIVAGGNGEGDHLDQLEDPQSMIVDQMGTVYVADWDNHRIMRWFKGSKSGSVIVDNRSEADPLSLPIDLTFDRHGNLYVVDYNSHRVKMYAIDKNSCSADTF
jgi:sugar lactone lactonase YvrE